MYEGKFSKHQTLWGRKGRYLVKEGALYLRELDITSGAHFTKGFSRQSEFMDTGVLQGQKNLNMLLRWQYLSINDNSSPTLSYSTGIPPTLGTVTVFAVWKCANNLSYHKPQG